MSNGKGCIGTEARSKNISWPKWGGVIFDPTNRDYLKPSGLKLMASTSSWSVFLEAADVAFRDGRHSRCSADKKAVSGALIPERRASHPCVGLALAYALKADSTA